MFFSSGHTVFIFPYNKDKFDQVLTYEEDGNYCKMVARPGQTPGEPIKFLFKLVQTNADPTKKSSWNLQSRETTNAFPVHSIRNGHYIKNGALLI